MSYIQETSSKKEYLGSRKSERTRLCAQTAINQFERLCQSKYQRNLKTVLLDLKNEPADLQLEKECTFLNQFVMWCSKDHPEIIRYFGRYKTIKRSFKALSPVSTKINLGFYFN